MKRRRLIWFAGGAATSAVAVILAKLFVPAPADREPYLSVSERPFAVGELERIEEIAMTSGELLRECGATRFFMKAANGSDGVPYSLIKINQKNDLAIHCVFERAPKEGYPLHIQMITDQHAQTY